MNAALRHSAGLARRNCSREPDGRRPKSQMHIELQRNCVCAAQLGCQGQATDQLVNRCWLRAAS
jgi:hypothetical protein